MHAYASDTPKVCACMHRFGSVLSMNLWAKYVREVSAGATQSDVAAKCEPPVNQSTVGRWLRGDYAPTDAATVAAFASGHGRNVLEAFVAAGMLDEADAGAGLPESSRAYLESLRRRSQVVEGEGEGVSMRGARRN